MKTIALYIITSLFFIGCSSSLQMLPTKIQNAAVFTTEIKKKISLNYLIYLPDGYWTSKKKWPLVMFLHGAGERGTDVNLVKRNGPPMLVEKGKAYDFILVSPQCPDKQWWDVQAVSALLDEMIAQYQVDEDRVYLTGLSMGGYGTWELAMQRPELFAAIAPVCGGGDSTRVGVLKKIPTWVFHGEKDNVVPVSESKRMVEALKTSGGNVQLTLYPEAGHDSWTETYNNPKFYEWMLSQKRSAAR